MGKNKLLPLFLSLFFFPSFVFASTIDDASLGLGTLTNYVGKVQTDENGNTRKFDFSPFFSASLKWFFYNNFSFGPELGCGLPESGDHKKIQRFHYQILGNISYTYEKNLNLNLGAGLAFTRLTSDGGEELLDNGIGKTSFHLPDFTSTSRNFILTIGGDYVIYQGWALATKMIAYNIADQNKRAFSYLVGINYHFGQQTWEF